ncbi:SAV0927 family protein [Brevibacillus sp. NRS-1366]|uniref:SAV0927 family protein n=1 Tax=Brevibacillus sp. NRS-1366 TaxID=3233899 RepID=UPI003D1CF91C
MKFDYLYDQSENLLSRFVTFATENNRYDLAFFYSQHFDGKNIVVSLQNMRAALISSDDISHDQSWIHSLDIRPEDVGIVSHFLTKALSSLFKHDDLD